MDVGAVALGPQEEENMSASARKFEAFGISLESLLKPEEIVDEANDCYFIMQESCLNLIFKCLPCPTCFQTHVLDVHLAEKEHCGFAVKITVVCTQCEHEILNMFSCQRIDGSSSSRQPFDVNLRAVLAFRGIGSGFSLMNDWCGIMNFPNCLAHKSYSSNQSKLREASMETFDRISKDSIKSITAAYEAIGTKPDEQGVLDIAVSYDGTWQKRGHSSHNGIGCVIDLITGLPIDYEVLSNFCLKCKIASEDRNTTNEW